MGKDVIIALDFDSKEKTLAFLDRVPGRKPFVKIGMELYYAEGPAIFPLAVRMVWQVYEAVRIPIIGMGGVRTAEDVLELMLAGATAVEVGAANLVDPFACRDLVNDLPRVMEQYHIQNLNDIIGGAHHG